MEIYTMQQWENDRTLKVAEGQLISPDVFYQLLECVPPQTYSNGIFQVGEPYAHDWNTGKALYSTFRHVSEDEQGRPLYKFIGLRYAGGQATL